MHYWFVLIGYAAEREGFDSPLKPSKNFDLKKLRNHRNYYFGAVASADCHNDFDIVVFDKNTNFEIARY